VVNENDKYHGGCSRTIAWGRFERWLFHAADCS
jgi:hypothetical protein